MFKSIIVASLLLGSIAGYAQEKLLCVSESFSAEFTLRDHQSADNFGLIQDSFNAVEVVGMNGNQPVYGDRALFVNLGYLMRLESKGGKFDFYGTVTYDDAVVEPVFSFRVDQVGDDANTFAGVMLTTKYTPKMSVTSQPATCTKRFSNPD